MSTSINSTAVQLSTRLAARDRETVIISTKDHQNECARASASCLTQDEPITIFVADVSYADSTSEMVANRFLMVQVIRHPTPLGIVPARNDVTNKVTIPFACTLDDDAVFTAPSIVRTTLAQFDHPRVAVVTVPLVNFINGERSNTPNR